VGLRIVVGSDNAGFEYKEALKADLEADDRVDDVIDVGVGANTDGNPYPNIGVAAGKVPGIRASVAHDSFSVERLIKSNNAQVLTFGQRVIGLELARKLAGEWLGYEFDESSASADKVAVLSAYESGNAKDGDS
jgi:ribose 5-phosphate isomerase B